MSNMTPVDGWYAVEASPKGGLKLTPVREMHMRNQRMFLDDAWDPDVDYRPLWMFKSLEAAESFMREAKGERGARRASAAEDSAEGDKVAG